MSSTRAGRGKGEPRGDLFGGRWVTAFPCFRWFLTNAEFTQVSAAYLGLPSPACLALAGQPVADTEHKLDAHGDALTSVKQCSGHIRKRHDSILRAILATFRYVQVDGQREPLNEFARQIPQARQQQFKADESRMASRQGIVPDFLMDLAHEGPKREMYFELKTVGHNGTRYPPGRKLTDEKRVDVRAAGLAAEYERKARNADAKYCGTQGLAVGPVLRALRQKDAVRGLVFGAFGEGSAQCHKLVSTLAEIGSHLHYENMHVASPAVAKGLLAEMFRRDWGLAVVKANAATILHNLRFVGSNVKAGGERRAAQERAWAAEAAEMEELFAAFRGFRDGNTWW